MEVFPPRGPDQGEESGPLLGYGIGDGSPMISKAGGKLLRIYFSLLNIFCKLSFYVLDLFIKSHCDFEIFV